MQGASSSSYQAAKEFGLAQSFTSFHGRLLDLCLAEMISPVTDSGDEKAPQLEEQGSILTRKDLSSLGKMVEMEFIASLRQELQGSETSDQADPHVFDIFLMKDILSNHSNGKQRYARPIAVCVPFKKELLWWNGLAKADGGNLWDLKPASHMRRLASLSGSARVLQALDLARTLASGESDNLVKWAMNRHGIFVVENKKREELSAFVTESSKPVSVNQTRSDLLNQSQQEVVNAIAAFRSGFMCIQGPPGTGKTTTMVSMIKAAMGQGGVIVTAPSNAAVANIALKLIATGDVTFGELAVYGENCDDSVKFLQPKFRSNAYVAFREAYDKAMTISDGQKEPSTWQKQTAANLLQDFVAWLHLPTSPDKAWSLSDLSHQCPIISYDENGFITMQGRHRMSEIFGSAKVVFSTLNSAGSFTLQSALDGENFTTLMLDEGCQCTEAEFFIAATFPGIQRIAIMGDPQQRRSTVIHPSCSLAGFGDSFLGRVFKQNARQVHLLDTQYRMDPQILAFPNKRFYKSRILCGDNVLNREPHVDRPFLFIDTHGRGRETKVGFSWQNQYEATVINVLLQSDPDIRQLFAATDRTTKIIVITPYKVQVHLLKDHLKLPKRGQGSKAQLLISTVDAFQGQEGDIVIVSTVRTKAIGFVDDAQRINVALTRAKRVLRVVGDFKFFESLSSISSTLRALVSYAKDNGCIEVSKVATPRYCPPDWSFPRRWKMLVTQKFQHCLNGMKSEENRNICLNTLFAIALPDLKSLKGGRVTDTRFWKMNCLTNIGSDGPHVVWIMKRDSSEEPIVEAHFAGRRNECLQFTQKNHQVHRGSVAPKFDMSGFHSVIEEAPEKLVGALTPCWTLDNNIQTAILSGKMSEMPISLLELDPPQKAVACSEPPLLIESRSGTGKTLVLLQHAALTSRMDFSRPACFVTVSPRLKEELKSKHSELELLLFDGLPPTQFFSFRELLYTLVDFLQISNFVGKDVCTYDGYCASRRSHQRVFLEPEQVENEIGGVIMGSVASAAKKSALDRSEYLEHKRSNITNKTKEGREHRNLVYDEFEKYVAWKAEFAKYDVSDVVLRLLTEDLGQMFSAVYLDEVQDLSYAAIYLICNIAGKDTQRWTCAGDPAQMISPGCSFTFDGLKQTLLVVTPGIEPKLKQVHHLVVNYRTTKDILDVANSVLNIAKQAFPGAIEYAMPETAVKDLGLRVVTCSWEAAMNTRVKFGKNQVFIYSPSNSATIPETAIRWLNGHPFIMSSLDSKGLEFDDVVIAFELDRKYWDVSRKLEASLRMLRELYVAVTRAQRRVVILVKSKNDNMKLFFRGLNCEDMPAETIFQEFDRETTEEEWREKGDSLLANERFKLAATCFLRAGELGWAPLATGKLKSAMGLAPEAEMHFRRAAGFFYEQRQFDKVLDMLRLLLSICNDWDTRDDKMFSSTLVSLPRYLPRKISVEFHLKREDWSVIRTWDLLDSDLAELFAEYRHHENLKSIVRNATDDQRNEMEQVIPWAHADFHKDRDDFMEAFRIFLCYGEYRDACECGENILRNATQRRNVVICETIVQHWLKARAKPAESEFKNLSLLLSLFRAPEKTATVMASECVASFGRTVIRKAVANAELDPTTLLCFRDNQFNDEVIALVEERFFPYRTCVVEWLVDNGHGALAVKYTLNQSWDTDDLLRLILLFRERPKWLLQMLEARDVLDAATVVILGSTRLSDWNKEHYRQAYKSCFPARTIPAHSNFFTLSMSGGVCARLMRKKMSVERLLVYLHLDQIHMAVESSIAALETHELASLNVAKVLRIWEERLMASEAHQLAPFTELPALRQNLLFKLIDAQSAWRDSDISSFVDEDSILNPRTEQPSSTWLDKIPRTPSSRLEFAELVKEYGPAATTYVRLCLGRHNDRLLETLREHFQELREKVRLRLEDTASGPAKQRRTRLSKGKQSKKGGSTTISSASPHQQGQGRPGTEQGTKKTNKNRNKGNKKKKRR